MKGQKRWSKLDKEPRGVALQLGIELRGLLRKITTKV